MELSELLPHTGRIVDEITLVRSMTTRLRGSRGGPAADPHRQDFAGRPGWGSWVLYGLGSMRQDLPAYVVLSDPGGLPVDGTKNWSSGFLPAVYQGTPFRATGAPVRTSTPPAGLPARRPPQSARLPATIERRPPAPAPATTPSWRPASAITNWPPACRPPSPKCSTCRRETAETRRLYGLDNPKTAEYGRRCLLARRLVETGRALRAGLPERPALGHARPATPSACSRTCARMTDQPSAALVTDLKRRGLLDSTIVLWTGEFGRLPVSQGTDGRDHNRHAFSLVARRRRLQAGPRPRGHRRLRLPSRSRTWSASPTCTPRCCTPSDSTTPA